MTALDAKKRAQLPDSAFAYVDSAGRRRLPINDEAHVRNALARFSHTRFESDAARQRARQRILRAAKRYGIVPIGFFDSQLRMEVERRRRSAASAPATPVESLPRGRIALLLSDIEGSTRLLARLGDRYAAVLDEVRAVHRLAVSAADGFEVDARADEFFAVFASAPAAVRAAVQIQRRMHERDWPDGADVRVRVGVHVGAPRLTATGYVGLDVHTAARVCSAGNGGQIILSDAAREALEDEGVGEVTLRPLGAFRLHGLPHVQRLYGVHAPAVDGGSAPLRAEPVEPVTAQP